VIDCEVIDCEVIDCEVIDCEVSDSRVDNKPVGVDTISIKKTARAVLVLKKKYRGSPTSFASDLTMLSDLKKEQMDHDNRFKDKQSELKERKVNVLEIEAGMRMEALQVEMEHKRLRMKADLLHQRLQLSKEGVSQPDIDNLLPMFEL